MNELQPTTGQPAAGIVPLFDQLPFNPGITPAERINFWHRAFNFNLGIALAAGLRAGHELSQVRESCGTRGFAAWCEKNLDFSRQQAYVYISAFEQTVMKQRLALPSPVPLSAPLTEEEVRTVAAEFGATTFRGLQKALSGPSNWGGARKVRGVRRRTWRRRSRRSARTRTCSSRRWRKRFWCCWTSRGRRSTSAFRTRSSRASWPP